ncbi:hypothetical protein [Advenella mimigardefordensis]|uniref:hypothetical protein n=1 Tax=Advenella mimigardefordensis TaxID=302406 RepID=UPI001C9D6742|nr:hypothetical protein [Advenella mimigardefordensis]
MLVIKKPKHFYKRLSSSGLARSQTNPVNGTGSTAGVNNASLMGRRLLMVILVAHLAELKKRSGRLPQIPSARMNNFITDYLSDNENRGSGKNDALKAWYELKASSLPKTYQAYKNAKVESTK